MPTAASVLCVDIGGSSAKAGVLHPDGSVSHTGSVLSQPPADEFCRNLVGLIERTRAAAGPVAAQLGVAVAGFLDEAQSYLLYNSNLAWLEGFPLRQYLADAFPGFDIRLEVDSNAAAMAEYRFGSGGARRRFLCLTCGTGLGVGMIIHGAPLRFAYGCMGDIGHIVVQRDGPVCTCGGRGCAEALLSSNTLAAEYMQLTGKGDGTLRTVIEAAGRSDPDAIGVLARAGEWLGVAAASIANTFFPDGIAIAGGLSAAGDIVLKPAEKVFRETASQFAQANTTFGRATLGATATLIGAAWPFWPQQEILHGEPISR